jgi:electron transfer flavoprotein alpha subunit
MLAILVFGAISEGALAASSLEPVAAARVLAQETGAQLYGGLIGHDCGAAADTFAKAGLAGLFVADHARHAPYVAESHIAAAEAIVRKCAPSLILFPQTAETSEWVPVLAGRLKAAMASACTKLAYDGEQLVATRPVCGGAVQGEYAFNRPLKIATLASGAYAPATLAEACPISTIDVPDLQPRVTVLEEIPDAATGGPRLKGARVVVSGGLGIGSKENWHLIEETAYALGAAVGGTRAVVELGWVPSTQQVGFSGQKISPELYIAIGISGAVHHLAGLAGAKTIVAVNKDPEAGIFRAARFGVIGDAREVMPAFVARVKELRAGRA